MKILLINPPHLQKLGLFPKSVFQPIGLAYLASSLIKAGHQVSILDALGEDWKKISKIDSNLQLIGLNYEEVREYVKTFNPDMVGIGAPFTMQAQSAFWVAKTVKKANQKIITVMGGPHVTSSPEECLKNQTIDFTIIGEGETTFLELVQALENKKQNFKDILGLGWKNNDNIFINPKRPPIANLDSLPFPARHLLPMTAYFEAAKSMKTGRKELLGKKSAVMITSRGCPYRCTFCVSHHLWGQVWRPRSSENVVDEIEELIKKYRVNHIHFEDDNLTFNKERVAKICDLILGRKLKFTWDAPNGIRADTIDEKTLMKMKLAGCEELCVAPESGNQYVVDHIIKKSVNLKKIEDVVRICKKIGIKIEAFFVIGSVGETKEQIKDTLVYARKLKKMGCRRSHFHIAAPFEGTELYELAKKNNYLKYHHQCIQLETPRIETPEFTCQEIDELFKEGIKINPAIPFDKLSLVFKLLLIDPFKFFKTAFRYLIKRQGGLSS